MRKEVNLTEEVVSSLQLLADKRKWSVKKYMEHILEMYAKKAPAIIKKTDRKYDKIAKELGLPKRKQSNKK